MVQTDSVTAIAPELALCVSLGLAGLRDAIGLPMSDDKTLIRSTARRAETVRSPTPLRERELPLSAFITAVPLCSAGSSPEPA